MTGLKQRLSRRSASGDTAGKTSRIPDVLRRRSKTERMPWGKKAQQPPAPAGDDEAAQTPVEAPAKTSRLPDLGKLAQRLPWSTRRPAATGTGGAPATEVVDPAGTASFRDRSKLRRRLQYLRRARELAFRDVGGLIFDMRRFERDRPDLVEAKLSALTAVDAELRALERVLDDRRPIHELREPGLSSCQRCGALHASEDNFCPQCGMQFGGALAMGEVGGAIAAPPQAPSTPDTPLTAPAEGAQSPPPIAPDDARVAPHPADAQTEVHRPSDAS